MRVSFTDDAGNAESVASEATEAVVAKPAAAQVGLSVSDERASESSLPQGQFLEFVDAPTEAEADCLGNKLSREDSSEGCETFLASHITSRDDAERNLGECAPGAEGMWIDYVYLNPHTGFRELKHSWVVRHDGLIFGSGRYELQRPSIVEFVSAS